MREILFRGKRQDNGEWIYGYYTTDQHGNHFIVDNSADSTEKTYPFFKIFSESVGQYTGMEDSEGNKVFENDILKDFRNRTNERFIQISYFKDAFEGKLCDGSFLDICWLRNIIGYLDAIVVGNTTDNPELLNTK